MICHFASEKSHEVWNDIRSGLEVSRIGLVLFGFANQIKGLKDYPITTEQSSSVEMIVQSSR
jgi:hypothetical protein